jgi:non-ribosomal peptide synthetase component F
MPGRKKPITEEQIPKIAKAATRAAYKRAIRISDVLVYRDGELRRVKADGTSEFVKLAEPRVRIPKGSKFRIEPEPA